MIKEIEGVKGDKGPFFSFSDWQNTSFGCPTYLKSSSVSVRLLRMPQCHNVRRGIRRWAAITAWT